MRIAVTGGSSGLMQRCAQAVATLGHEVELFGRTGSGLTYFDLENPSPSLAKLRSFDLVIHGAFSRDNQEANMTFLREAIDELSGTGTKIILISSFVAANRFSSYGRSKRLLEEQVLGAGWSAARLGVLEGEPGLVSSSLILRALQTLRLLRIGSFFKLLVFVSDQFQIDEFFKNLVRVYPGKILIPAGTLVFSFRRAVNVEASQLDPMEDWTNLPVRAPKPRLIDASLGMLASGYSGDFLNSLSSK